MQFTLNFKGKCNNNTNLNSQKSRQNVYSKNSYSEKTEGGRGNIIYKYSEHREIQENVKSNFQRG